MLRKFLALLLAVLLACFGITAFAQPDELVEVLVEDNIVITDELMVEYGYDYSTPEEVALYLHAFEELPPNFFTKKEARSYGWDSGYDLWGVAEGMSIGGDRFGNYEGLLPDAEGRQWYECDVNYYGGHRGAERLLFSNDGMICYSGDHYNSYEVLYESWYYEDGWYLYD